MGCALKEQEVMDLIGATIPNDDDLILQNPEAAASREQQDMGNGPGSAGGFDTTEEQAGQLADALGVQDAPPNQNGSPPAEKAPPGQTVTTAQNGKFSTVRIPRGDTGNRRRARGKVSALRRLGYRAVYGKQKNGDKKPLPPRRRFKLT
jgi:hypothetical protein